MSDNETKEPAAWLITVAQDDCRGFVTIPTKQHPADYVAENDGYSLIFAIPISRKQFSLALKKYTNG